MGHVSDRAHARGRRNDASVARHGPPSPKVQHHRKAVGNIDQPCRSEGAESLLVIASVGRASDNS